MANEIEKRNETFLIYQDENGIARVNVRFEGEDVWLTVEQIMELFDASQQDVSYHIKQIYADGEQDAERTHKKFLLVRQEGNRSVRRNMSHYNLDMIIAVGYRVKSQVATLTSSLRASTTIPMPTSLESSLLPFRTNCTMPPISIRRQR